MKEYIKSIEISNDEVINMMTSYLETNEGFATKVCEWLSEYFYDMAEELIEEEYDDDDEVCGYHIIDSKRELAETLDKISERFDDILSYEADKNDYYNHLYYRMHDWYSNAIRNYAPVIIKKYLEFKLGLSKN